MTIAWEGNTRAPVPLETCTNPPLDVLRDISGETGNGGVVRVFTTFSAVFEFESGFWGPKTSQKVQNMFLESSRVIEQNLTFLSKI